MAVFAATIDSTRKRFVRGLFAVVALAAVAGCATAPPENEPEERKIFFELNDPFEPLNRQTFEFNRGVEFWILRPIGVTYRDLVPNKLREWIHNALDNLNQPLVFINDLLQADFTAAGKTFGRFLANSTIGIAGAFDIFPEWGRREDFGQTLAVWGLGDGFYLVLPVLGPSSLRDGVGLAVDSVMDPWSIWLHDIEKDNYTYIRTALYGIDLYTENMESLADIQRSSLDYYAALRSLYRQRRDNLIRNGEPAPRPKISAREIGPTAALMPYLD
jgi:phospholipid-binding lipoprotein MlaA